MSRPSDHGAPGISPANAAALLGALAALWMTPSGNSVGPTPQSVPPGKATPPSRLLTPEETAKRLSVTVRWLYRNAKRLPFTRKLSRRVLRFEEAGLERYIRERRP